MSRERKTRDVYVIQQYTAQGWEDVTAEDSRSEARQRLKEYRDNQPEFDARMVKRREPKAGA